MQDEKLFTELRQGVLERAAGSQLLAAVKTVADAESGRRRGIHRSAYLFAKMRDTQDDALDTLLPEQVQLMKDEGTSGHLEQRFGDAIGERTESGRPSAGEYGDGQHPQHRTTLVPSKSNRNRTSSSPASAMAARNRPRSDA
jgi:hypothetical protein